MDPLRLPAHLDRWALKNARVPACLLAEPIGVPDAEGLVKVDIAVAAGRIAALAAPSNAASEVPAFVEPGLVMPAFIDAHTHLDKGHISPRAPSNGTFPGALVAVPRDREAHWSASDVEARMTFSVAAAYAYGTRAIRTHLDCKHGQTRISYEAFGRVREAWHGKVELQASPLFPIDLALDDGHMADVVAMVEAHGACLGALTVPGPALEPGLARLFRIAGDKGWDLDFHVDESDDPTVNSLARVAQAAIDHRFEGRILCGHCCTLTLLPDEQRKRTVELVARAGLRVVSLPMCNMYLQDRHSGRTPRWRGITALHELKAAGVPVLVASDNTRDPFYAYGDLDMAEVWRSATRIAQLDHPFGDWPGAVFTTPAAALGLPDARLRAGATADFVVVPARSLSEFMARPALPRTVIRDGKAVRAALPSFAALDHLQGLRP